MSFARLQIPFLNGKFLGIIFLFVFLNFFTCVASYGIVKVKPVILIVSLEGDASVYNIVDDFEVNLTSSSIGRKIDSKSIIKTEKNGSIGLLFSNGTLITVKSGSRFFLREYSQKIIAADNLPEPSKLEEEPSQSQLLAHLDYGELVVKVPKLKKGSTMNLSSPLGTAGIRGTMFQMMAVRNEITGDIMGGVNLISGDIQFINTSGMQTDLFSGQSIQLATSRFGETRASETGGLVALSEKFGNSLTQNVLPEPIEIIFPNLMSNVEESEQDGIEFEQGNDNFNNSQTFSSNWDLIHDIASEIFFEIEESEKNSDSYSFSSLNLAEGAEVPVEVISSVPVSSVVGSVDGSMASDFSQGPPPEVSIVEEQVFEVEMLDLPFSEQDPYTVEATDFLQRDISAEVVLLNPPDTKFPGIYTLNYRIEDTRGFVSTVSRTVKVVVTPPEIVLKAGSIYPKFLRGNEEIIPYPVRNNKKSVWGPTDRAVSYTFGSESDDVQPSFYILDYDGNTLPIEEFASITDNGYINNDEIGETKFTISVSDFDRRGITTPDGKEVTTSVDFTIQIVDRIPPIIEIKEEEGSREDNPYEVKGVIGSFFDDPGIEIIDNYFEQSEIEEHLGLQPGAADSAFGFVNMEVAGDYRLDYQGIEDPSGNEAETKSRWVRVLDEERPKLTLYGPEMYYVDLSSPTLFKDPGAFAIDDLDGLIDWEDGNGRVKVSIEKLVNGEYIKENRTFDEIISEAKEKTSVYVTHRLTYTVKDVAGNPNDSSVLPDPDHKFAAADLNDPSDTVQRDVVLINSPVQTPELHRIGDEILYHEVNTPFEDPGVRAYKYIGEIGDEGDSAIERIDLREYIETTAYLINSNGEKKKTFVDPTKVNYHNDPEQGKLYVNPYGEEFSEDDPQWRKLVIEYVVTDQFGNTNEMQREVRIQDTTIPKIVLNSGPQGVNFPDQQSGQGFVDPGFVVSDNYDSSESVSNSVKIKYFQLGSDSSEKELSKDQIEFIASDGFSEVGEYIIRYQANDINDNVVTVDRTISVIDTIPPQVSLVTHNYFTGQELQTINNSDFPSRPIVNFRYPIPTEISNFLSPISSQFSETQVNNSVFALTLGDNKNFYLALEPISELEIVEIESFFGNSNLIEIVDPETKRSRVHYSAFNIQKEGKTLIDPGVYVRNDSDLKVEISHSFSDPTYGYTQDKLDQERILSSIKVNYFVKQIGSGEIPVIEEISRTIYFLDFEKPYVIASPTLQNNEVFVINMPEKSNPYPFTDQSDLNGIRQITEKWDLISKKFSKITEYNINAKDAVDGDVTDNVTRTIFEGDFESDIGANVELSSFRFVGRFDGDISESQMSQAIPRSLENLNRIYRIDYEFSDDRKKGKQSKFEPNTVNYSRYFILKDIIPPKIDISYALEVSDSSIHYENNGPGKGVIELDYLENSSANAGKKLVDGSTMSVRVNDESSVKRYLAMLLEIDDFDSNLDYDNTKDEKWSIDISPSFKGAALHPNSLESYISDPESGYKVTISVTDESGNNSGDTILRLAIVDSTPPEIFLLGDREIHDFYRFGENDSLDNNELPFPDRLDDHPSNVVKDANGEILTPFKSTGFARGEHRMLLNDYNFIDPGAYAEDYNGNFDLRTGLYPDLDGDGIGESYILESLNSGEYELVKTDVFRSDSFEAGVIYVYTEFTSVKDEQIALSKGESKNEEFATTNQINATIPNVENLEFNSSVENVSQINIRRTTFSFAYRVKDSWNNLSKIKDRSVHIYESQQFPGFAFYATPIVEGVELASYFDANGTSDNFLSSIRKDNDGDGVSDFWEVILNDEGQNAHLDPSFVDYNWNNTNLNQKLAQLTRKQVVVDSEVFWVNNFVELKNRAQVLLDAKANEAISRNGLITTFEGFNTESDPLSDFRNNNTLKLDFNKAIP